MTDTIFAGSKLNIGLGPSKVYAGAAAAAYFGVPVSDPRHPVIFGVAQNGVIYAAQPDIEQHGGADLQDVSIPTLAVRIEHTQVLPGLPLHRI